MAGKKDTKADPASPVCYLDQGDAAYKGYLTSKEIVAELRRLMARIEDDRVHAKLMEIVRELEKP